MFINDLQKLFGQIIYTHVHYRPKVLDTFYCTDCKNHVAFPKSVHFHEHVLYLFMYVVHVFVKPFCYQEVRINSKTLLYRFCNCTFTHSQPSKLSKPKQVSEKGEHKTNILYNFVE